MMRAMSLSALILSLACLGWATIGLVETLETPERAIPRIGVSLPSPVAGIAAQASPPFLAIYGSPTELGTVVPRPVVNDDPFGFVLKGLIAVGDVRWAVLSKDGADVVVREGEVLEGGLTISRVHAEGIELTTDDGPMMLSFNADEPVSLREVPAGVALSDASGQSTGPKGNFVSQAPTAMLFQDMTPDEIMAALEAAEERRAARGWVTESE